MIDATLARSASLPNGKNPANNAVKIPNPHVNVLGTLFWLTLVNFSGNNPSRAIVYVIRIPAYMNDSIPAIRPITAPRDTIPATLFWPTSSSTNAKASPVPSLLYWTTPVSIKHTRI